MRAFGNPIGNPVRGADGGQGTKIGDIVFAAKAPSSNFIPIVNQRVYADQYPRLADVLQVRRENDGGEWLRPGGIFPNVDPSNGQTFVPSFGGVSAGENFLFMHSGNTQPVVARGPASTKVFSELALFGPGSAARIDGAVSDNGTVIVVRLHQSSDYIRGDIVRSTNALRTYTQRGFPASGLGPDNANRFQGRVSILPMGSNRWIMVNARGDVYRSDDDGLNWTFVKTLTWTGTNFQGNSVNEERSVLTAIAVGGRIWVAAGDSTQNAGNNTEFDMLIWSDDFFANYGRIRAKNPGMAVVVPGSFGLLGGDLAVVSACRTTQENNVGSGDLPVRGMYLANADPNSAPAFFELPGTTPYGLSASSTAVFSWDNIGYMGIYALGFYRVEPRTFARTFLAQAQPGGGGTWDRNYSFAKFGTFGLVFSAESRTLPRWSAELLQAVPTDLARRYYQFSEASVVGAQRSDGKLPFMRAR